MRELGKYMERCTAMLDELHIPYSKNIINVSVSNKERTWGRCIAIGTVNYMIEISYKLVNPEITETDDGLINTMLHELLHTCADCTGHDRQWKRYAQMIYDRYGIDIKRTSSDEEKQLNRDVIRNQYTYMVQCTKCGNLIGRYRMSDVIKNPNSYRCKCGGNLTRTK